MSRRIMTEISRDQIIRNPSNDSTSKACWSFSKSLRFKSDKKPCPHLAYDVPLSTNTKRKTIFGYGKRTDFKLNNFFVPSPGNYDIKRQFEENVKKGKTFGVSRQKTQQGSYIPLDPLRVPGPGQYIKVEISDPKKGYTIRPKTAYDRNYFIEDKELNLVPGPGRYEKQVSLGINTISRYRSSNTPNLNTKSNRWEKLNNNPGPGSYLQHEQKYVQSIHRYDPGKTIGKQTRTSFTENISRNSVTPGPGKYQRLKTDF